VTASTPNVARHKVIAGIDGEVRGTTYRWSDVTKGWCQGYVEADQPREARDREPVRNSQLREEFAARASHPGRKGKYDLRPWCRMAMVLFSASVNACAL
jgi:hypothetical protein